MSTTADLPPAAPGPEGDAPPNADEAARTGAIGDIRKFLDDAGDDLPGPESPLGEIAVSRGYITDEQLEECLEEQKVTTPHVLIGELLLRHKYITPEQLLRTLAAQKKPDQPPQLPEGAKIGKYSLIRELGRGGMGVVFEAEDPDLRRRVAIKVLKEEITDPTAAERMRREAAIAAQLRHPGIVAIHEVGQTKPETGHPLPFIAMDYVEGRTLADLLEEKKTARKDLLRILEDVSRAVAHAHAAGVIHRDLKPANVIVEKSGRAMLSDFGIARATSFQTKITETSFIVGTPEYMAPEQIQDLREHIGPATDVHALGIILYEILTGSLPYRADTPVALMRKIISEEPVPPRQIDPSVEVDLETICLKALEKEGRRRYRSADAFADDLLRFRTGRPLNTRRSGPVSKLWAKFLRRKKLVLGIGGGAAAALLLVILLGIWGGRQRREAIRLLNDGMERAIRGALELRRSGDLQRMKVFAADGLEACEGAAARYPRLAEPHAHQGRMRRALMEYDRAIAEQELALVLNPACARARYERLVLTSRLLRRREDELIERAWRGLGEKLVHEGATKIRAEDVTVPPREKLAKGDAAARALRERMESDLEALEAPGTEEIGAAELACARGLVKRSRPQLQAALQKAPFLEEAVEALALLERDAGKYDKAIAVWSDGLEHDKGCLPHYEGRGKARLDWGQQKFYKGEESSEVVIAAIGDFSEVLKKDPKRDGAIRDRGMAYFLLGYSIGWSRSDDATRQFQLAAEDLGHALELNPKDAATWMWRGVVRASLSVSRFMALQDPIPLCKEAMEDLGKALERNPEGDEPYFWRALARIPWSVWLALKGENIQPLYDDSIADLGRALRLNPGRGETWLARANIHVAWGNYLTARGKDPAETLQKATQDLDIASQKIPEGIQAPERRGQIEMLLAESPGEDAVRHYRTAIASFDLVLARSAQSGAGFAGRGLARARLGSEMVRRKENPAAMFEEAFRDLDAAVKSDATFPAVTARTMRAEGLVRRGEWKMAAGRNGDEDFQSALVDTKKALELNLLVADAWIWQGRAKALSAPQRLLPIPHYGEAIEDLRKVLFISPDHLLALRFRADAYRLMATLKATRRMRAEGDFNLALIDYQHIVRLRPAAEAELRDEIEACKAGSK
jgi:tetratricopeptide (TPR) repeat protein/predicted Ser/Thr protein kinase